MQIIRKIRHPSRDFTVPIVVAKIPIGVAAQVQVEEIVFYSVHNPAPSTSNTTLPLTTTPPTQHPYNTIKYSMVRTTMVSPMSILLTITISLTMTSAMMRTKMTWRLSFHGKSSHWFPLLMGFESQPKCHLCSMARPRAWKQGCAGTSGVCCQVFVKCDCEVVVVVIDVVNTIVDPHQ